jgi:hypothetical protein
LPSVGSGAVCAVCLRKRKSRFILASLAVLIAAVFALSFWSSPPAVPSGGAETEGTLAAAEEVSAGAEPEASPAVAEEASAGAEPEASPAAGEEASAGAEPTASPSAYDLVTSLRLTEMIRRRSATFSTIKIFATGCDSLYLLRRVVGRTGGHAGL